MKVLVIGGTNFIGPHVVRQLIEMGHEVTVFNRGQTTAELPEEVKWIKGDRHNLSDYRSQFQQLAPEVVLDMIPYTAKDALGVVDTFKDIAQRVVAISSGDVYRARDIVWQKETGIIDRTPLTENSPLRSQLYPYRGLSDEPFAHDYDKIPVEQVLMSATDLPATILRLPMVYGAGDYQHRLYPYFKRMDDKRPAIVLEEKLAHWQGCYGYVENVAYAIALAVNNEKAKGRIYNVAELPGSTVADLVKAIAKIVGWQGEIVIIPKTQMPASWEFKANLNQHWITDSSRLRTELDYTEIVDRDEAFRKTISWERKHPPEEFSEVEKSKLLDYTTEDKVLASLNRS
ncbi:MAG: NAD-dependent epimerase/dehydratase family protein [Xenococcaceae cyanobacterium MO_188.B29]|nr:NAD-dependent epimerase/dehydratase family protein [Xenococcaceae cyanobacterium MO_188.B29]